jgi:DNA-binding MarR family transcriptional regulator
MDNQQEPPWGDPRFRNWVSLIRAHKAVDRVLAKALASLSLKVAQLDLLMNVHRHPGITQQDLARRLLVGRSNVTMLLPELERRKLLKRSADMKDKRVLRLSLTDEGRDLLGKALPIYAGLIEQVMSQSSDAECELIGKTMDRITAMLEGNGV